MNKTIKSYKMQRKWKKKNKHNYTFMSNLFPIDSVRVGNGTYGGLYVLASNPNYHLKIGSYCSIAKNVTFILGDDHRLDLLSTYPFRQKNGLVAYEAISKGDIIIEDDVWIANGATILSGITIGRGAVIAAGAVVTKNVPPYSIVGGCPAQVIKYRFSESIIRTLTELNFSALRQDDILKNIDCFYEPITEENVERIIHKLKKGN